MLALALIMPGNDASSVLTRRQARLKQFLDCGQKNYFHVYVSEKVRARPQGQSQQEAFAIACREYSVATEEGEDDARARR